MKRLVVLGSTGSLGVKTLEVARKQGFSIVGLAAHSNVTLIEQQIRQFHPRAVALYDEAAARDLRVRVQDCNVRVLAGMEGLCTLAAMMEADVVLNSVVGMVGLLPTLTALRTGHDVALANKETLVAGGELVMRTARENGVRILPVDSEHSAIFQCLQGAGHGWWSPPESPQKLGIHRLILTASGGPFFGKTMEELKYVTPADALKHPNWAMGAKITVDSATMMNKGLELIEARWLFDIPQENIDIVIHRESVVHSLVEFTDYSVLAQMGVPDMCIPIQYALTWPCRYPSPVKRISLTDIGKLTFYKPDYEAFPCMDICRRSLQQGGAYPAAINAANEVANERFRLGEISYPKLTELVAAALERSLPTVRTEQDILAVDAETRVRTLELIK